MQVVILCGGKGTRLREYTEQIPKPLVEVGGLPILWHVMKIYAHFGFHDFILALGYLGERIKEYFCRYEGWRTQDCRLRFRPTRDEQYVELLGGDAEDWQITFADTGLETNTGGRIKAVEKYITGPTFMATYADGLADIDLRALLDSHQHHSRIATLTTVRPRSQFGIVEFNSEGQVQKFIEKPKMEQWVNGGFFVFNRDIFRYLQVDSILEREPFERLAADGQIFAHLHTGFWQCMDTYKDMEILNQLWHSGQAPWKVWD